MSRAQRALETRHADAVRLAPSGVRIVSVPPFRRSGTAIRSLHEWGDCLPGGSLGRLNPFSCLLAIPRAALLGTLPNTFIIVQAVIVSPVVVGVGTVGFAHARSRIVC